MRFLPLLAILVSIGCVSTKVAEQPDRTVFFAPEPDLNKEIVFHQERVKNDPQGALGQVMLAEAYLAKASRQDNDQAGVLAERSARESLRLRTKSNQRAAVALVHSLLQQHRFVEANETATQYLKQWPGDMSLNRLTAETALEIGDYKQFETYLPALKAEAESPESLVTLSRWYEVTGQPESALGSMNRAMEIVRSKSGLRKSLLSSYVMKLAELQERNDNLPEANKLLHEAIELDSSSYKALGGLARINLKSRNYKQAIRFAKESLAIAKLTNVQSVLAQAYKALGDQELYQETLKEMFAQNGFEPNSKSVAHSHPAGHTHAAGEVHSRHTHNRLLAQSLVEMGIHYREAHLLAEQDLEFRKDIIAYDCFAWATYQYWKNTPATVTGEGNKLLEEAVEAIKEATRTGTKDPTIRAHYRVIQLEAEQAGVAF